MKSTSGQLGQQKSRVAIRARNKGCGEIATEKAERLITMGGMLLPYLSSRCFY